MGTRTWQNREHDSGTGQLLTTLPGARCLLWSSGVRPSMVILPDRLELLCSNVCFLLHPL